MKFWTQEKLAEAVVRAEMAAEVTLPIDQFKELISVAQSTDALREALEASTDTIATIEDFMPSQKLLEHCKWQRALNRKALEPAGKEGS